MSTLHQQITTMDSNDKMDDSGWNLTHNNNNVICIGENDKVTQHDPGFENNNEGDDEEHLEAPHHLILAINIAKKNDRICQSKNLLEGHTRTWHRSSYLPLDINCPKQRRIFNCCDQVDLQTIEHRQELYTYTCGININKMLLIGQLMWIVPPGKEEKLNTYTYYK